MLGLLITETVLFVLLCVLLKQLAIFGNTIIGMQKKDIHYHITKNLKYLLSLIVSSLFCFVAMVTAFFIFMT